MPVSIRSSMQFYCGEGEDRKLCPDAAICRAASSLVGYLDPCECLPGLSADKTLLHLENCSLHDNELNAIFAVVTLASISAVMFAVVSKSQFRPEIRRYITLAIGQTMSVWGVAFCVFTENGFYESATVLLCIARFISVVCIVQMNLLTLKPISVMIEQSLSALNFKGQDHASLTNFRWTRHLHFQLASYLVIGVTLVIQVLLTLDLIDFARDANPRKFNFLMILSHYIFMGTILILAALSYFVMSNLRHHLGTIRGNAFHEKCMETMVARLKTMIRSSMIVMMIFTVSLCFPIAWAITKHIAEWYNLKFLVILAGTACMAMSIRHKRGKSPKLADKHIMIKPAGMIKLGIVSTMTVAIFLGVLYAPFPAQYIQFFCICLAAPFVLARTVWLFKLEADLWEKRDTFSSKTL